MELDIVRKIRGNLHGSIDISRLEDEIIQHPSFQRLRRVRQTAFLSLVFPGATHTRFEHSLGVMQQAGVAWRKLYENQKRLIRSLQAYPKFETLEAQNDMHGVLGPTVPVLDKVFRSSYVFQTLRIAALLHDLGHPPFSHSGERFLPTFNSILNRKDSYPNYLSDYLEEMSHEVGEDKAVSHEVMTLLLLERCLREIYAKNNFGDLKIDPRDICAILNTRISPAKDSPLMEFGLNTLCHELVSGEIDIDRMDYLLRDSRECGVVYGIFDVDRIMDSLTIYCDQKSGDFHLAIQLSGLAAFEDYLRARQSMYVQLYFHKTSVAAEAMLQYIFHELPDFRLPSQLERYLECDEWTIGQILNEHLDSYKGSNKTQIKAVIRDVIYDRKLWKRVFELTHNDSEDGQLETIEKLLQQNGYSTEGISSKFTLTTFKKRRLGTPSKNYLRLIKKDTKQFPRVVPIEDFSRLIADENSIEISRIYINLSGDVDRDQKVKTAKKLLRDHFLK